MKDSRLQLSITFTLLLSTASFLIVNTGSTGSDQLIVPDTAYYLKVYNSINLYRAKHVVTSLKWNRTLNDLVETLAIQLVSSPSVHVDPEDFDGVNYYGVPGGRPSASTVVSTWYNESVLYDYNNPVYGISYLNFTQMVWKSSLMVGIGGATYKNFSVVVARFYPPGNVKGKFRINVIPARL